MRQWIVATLFCLVAGPCAAAVIEAIPAQWNWPPFKSHPTEHADSSARLPFLISAAQYGTGLTEDIWRQSLARLGVFQSFGKFPVGRTPLPLAAPQKPPVPMEDVCAALVTSAHNHNLPVRFFMRLIWQESGFDAHAVSPVGAQGVAQFMPATADEMGLDDPFDPIPALRASARLLDQLIEQFGNVGLAAAAYNAGPKRVIEWLKRRANLPKETRHYVLSITGHPPDRWRRTEPGTLDLTAPKRAPCPTVADAAPIVEVPAPVPPPLPKPRTRVAHQPTKPHGPTRIAHHRVQMIINVADTHHRPAASKRTRPAHVASHRPTTARQAKAEKPAHGRRMQVAMGSSVNH